MREHVIFTCDNWKYGSDDPRETPEVRAKMLEIFQHQNGFDDNFNIEELIEREKSDRRFSCMHIIDSMGPESRTPLFEAALAEIKKQTKTN